MEKFCNNCGNKFLADNYRIRYCSICKKLKSNESYRKYYHKNKEYFKDKSTKYYEFNRERIIDSTSKYAKEHREEQSRKSKLRRQKRYLEVIKVLGGKCVRCGFDDWRALEINHKFGCPKDKNGRRQDWDYLKIGYDYNLVELLCGNCHNIETWGKQKDLYAQSS